MRPRGRRPGRSVLGGAGPGSFGARPASPQGVEPIAAPKGGGFADPRPFPLQTSRFLGVTAGAMMRIADPGRHPPRLARRSGGRRRCPRCGSTCHVCKSQTIPLLPPKGPDPRTLQLFPCKLGTSWEPRWGPRWRSRTPLTGTRRGSPAVVVGDGDAPLRQYFSRLQEADEPIAAPKGDGFTDPRPFPLEKGTSFLGTKTGAMMAIADPCGRHRFVASPPWQWGTGHARVVAVLGPVCKSGDRLCAEVDHPRRDLEQRGPYRAASTLTASPCVTKTSPLRGSAAAHTAPVPTGMDSTSRFVSLSMTSTVPSKNVGT